MRRRQLDIASVIDAITFTQVDFWLSESLLYFLDASDKRSQLHLLPKQHYITVWCCWIGSNEEKRITNTLYSKPSASPSIHPYIPCASCSKNGKLLQTDLFFLVLLVFFWRAAGDLCNMCMNIKSGSNLVLGALGERLPPIKGSFTTSLSVTLSYNSNPYLPLYDGAELDLEVSIKCAVLLKWVSQPHSWREVNPTLFESFICKGVSEIFPFAIQCFNYRCRWEN